MNENLMIENGIFSGFSSDITVPEGVKRIAPLALSGLEHINSLTLPSTLEDFSPCHLRDNFDTNTKYNYEFSNWSKQDHLSQINISPENPYYKSVNGALYSKNMTKLVYQPPSRFYDTVAVAFEEGITELCEDSACYVEAKQIIFPKSLRRIEAKACCGMNLKNSEIPTCSLGESAFQGCKLPKLTVLHNEVIPKKAFGSCTNVIAIRICDSVKVICNEAFSYTRMEKIYIPPTTELEGDPFVIEEQRFAGAQTDPDNPEKMKYIMENYLTTYKEMTIGGAIGSPAHKFAIEREIPFEEVESTEEAITEWLGTYAPEHAPQDFGLPF